MLSIDLISVWPTVDGVVLTSRASQSRLGVGLEEVFGRLMPAPSR